MTTSREIPPAEKLSARIEALEVTLAFQDDMLEALQLSVAKQQQEMQTLQDQLRLLTEYIKTMRDEGIRAPQDEAPPPHY